MFKIPENSTKRIENIAKKQKAIRSINFCDRQSVLYHSLSTGVAHENTDRLDRNFDHVIQYKRQIDDNQEDIIDEDIEAHEENNDGSHDADTTNDQESHDGKNNDNVVDAESNKNTDNADPYSTSNDDNNVDIRVTAFANRVDEFEQPVSNNHAGVTESSDDEGVTVARSSRISDAYDWSKNF